MGRKRTVNTEEASYYAAILLGQRLPKHAVRKSVEVQFHGKRRIPARSFERIVARAREILAQSDSKTRKELRNEARQFYEGMIADPLTPPAVRVRAQEALDKLYGLPITRVVHSGTGEGGAIKTESTSRLDLSKLAPDELRVLRDIRAKAIPPVGDN